MNDEKCRFHVCGRHCKILMGMDCDGTDENCSFYKTEFQFHKDADRAILINREKGNCKKCRYNINPCELSLFSRDNKHACGGKDYDENETY